MLHLPWEAELEVDSLTGDVPGNGLESAPKNKGKQTGPSRGELDLWFNLRQSWGTATSRPIALAQHQPVIRYRWPLRAGSWPWARWALHSWGCVEVINPAALEEMLVVRSLLPHWSLKCGPWTSRSLPRALGTQENHIFQVPPRLWNSEAGTWQCGFSQALRKIWRQAVEFEDDCSTHR